MTDPSVLVLDLGGVVCRFRPERRLLALAELTGRPPAVIDQDLFASGFDDAAERGALAPDTYRADLRHLLGLPDNETTAARLTAAWAQAFDPDRRVLDLLTRVTVPLVLFTNNGPLLDPVLADERREVAAPFDTVLTSWRLGARTPDPAAFAGATAALGVDPGRVFFVDDSPANVDAARTHGWQVHLHRTDLELRAALTTAGLLGPPRSTDPKETP